MATTPTHPHAATQKKRSISMDLTCSDIPKNENCPPQLRSPAIFSNSSVSKNKKLLLVEK